MKAIVTRSKFEVRFDDRDRVITIRTPSHQVISLNDTSGEIHLVGADQNSVTLGSSGIRMTTRRTWRSRLVTDRARPKRFRRGGGSAGVLGE